MRGDSSASALPLASSSVGRLTLVVCDAHPIVLRRFIHQDVFCVVVVALFEIEFIGLQLDRADFFPPSTRDSGDSSGIETGERKRAHSSGGGTRYG